jgi:hypothetical protein
MYQKIPISLATRQFSSPAKAWRSRIQIAVVKVAASRRIGQSIAWAMPQLTWHECIKPVQHNAGPLNDHGDQYQDYMHQDILAQVHFSW